jgi:pyruvate,orthophosphate dikinase
VLTSEGGKASHAALVARGMGRPAVTGAGDLNIDLHAREVRVNGRVLHEGGLIAIDGTAGAITLDDVPLVTPTADARFETLLRWCDGLCRLGVRANADTPEDARRARVFGAEGVGLCRTEHMFMAADRQPKMQRMILAEDETGRREALDELLPLQQADFEGIFEAMEGLPITIRLLDPPLHEFMPDLEDLPDGPERDRVRALHEFNPMLGTRGVRLGVIHPEIYEMQARAIFRAMRAVRERTGHAPRVEIVIPLVAYAGEFAMAGELILRVAADEGVERDGEFIVGTMIELPRACLAAGEIAQQAEFFSFGTNDLTQTGLGFSRDDIEAAIVPAYVDGGIIDRSPFATIDARGVGELVQIAIERGRAARPGLEVGICGEHGGTPTPSASSTPPAWTTSAAHRSACRSRGSPRPRHPRATGEDRGSPAATADGPRRRRRHAGDEPTHRAA